MVRIKNNDAPQDHRQLLQSDELLPEVMAYREALPKGHPVPSPAQRWRNRLKGAIGRDGRRVYLPWLCCGGKPYSSCKAVRWFFEQTTPNPEATADVVSQKRERTIGRRTSSAR